MLHRDRLMPPRRVQRHGRADFAERGEHALGLLVDLGGLRPGERVLELGCGAGALARVLVPFLQGGAYEGLDVDGDAVGWCRRAYRRHRHARFLRADLYDPREHPGGAHVRAEYRLPYGDGEFGLVVALGGLAHELEDAAARTLSESARVLAPGGRLVATAFVLDEASRSAVAEGRATFAFSDPEAHVAVADEAHPEEAVAYDRAWLAERFGGTVDVHPGRWRGQDEGRDLLDVVVARRA